jgi:hypothetical protein
MYDSVRATCRYLYKNADVISSVCPRQALSAVCQFESLVLTGLSAVKQPTAIVLNHSDTWAPASIRFAVDMAEVARRAQTSEKGTIMSVHMPGARHVTMYNYLSECCEPGFPALTVLFPCQTVTLPGRLAT